MSANVSYCPYCGTPYPRKQEDGSYKCSNPNCANQSRVFSLAENILAGKDDVIVEAEEIPHSVEVPLVSAPAQISTENFIAPKDPEAKK